MIQLNLFAFWISMQVQKTQQRNLPGWQMRQEICSFFAFPTTFAISTSPPPCLWPTMSKCQVLNCICVMPAGPICMFFVRTPDQSLVRQFLHCLLDHIATLAYSQYILAHFYFCLCFCLYMYLYFDWCFMCLYCAVWWPWVPWLVGATLAFMQLPMAALAMPMTLADNDAVRSCNVVLKSIHSDLLLL